MRTSRLYCPQDLSSGAVIQLSQEQANYIGKVLRLRPNEYVNLFDGMGQEFKARILNIERKTVQVELIESVVNHSESPLTTELGQVISRGDRMDYAVQKSTELGVSVIAPLFSERCEVRLDPARQEKRRNHWQQVACSASEQSGRAVVPDVRFPQHLSDWIERVEADLKIILHPPVERSEPDFSKGLPEKVAVLTGPEGGFSEPEVETCRSMGFICMSLGARILRTETAPVIALALIQQKWGDMTVF